MLDDLVPAAVTAVGSMPGTSPVDAVGLVVGELGQGDGVPHLPELPARGPGADMVGRTAGLLADIAPDLAVETTPDGWRFADAPGRSMRRARSWLAEDLDAFEEALDGYDGWVGASLTGPWTLAAAIELRRGERAVRDAGACRDLAGALAQAAEAHVAELRRRVPAARIMLWFDEPALPAVLVGSLPTQSGRGRYAAVEQHVVEASLAALVDAVHGVDAAAVIHCCAERPPLALLRRTGADALSVDLLLHDQRDDDELGELLRLGASPRRRRRARHGARERVAGVGRRRYGRPRDGTRQPPRAPRGEPRAGRPALTHLRTGRRQPRGRASHPHGAAGSGAGPAPGRSGHRRRGALTWRGSRQIRPLAGAS